MKLRQQNPALNVLLSVGGWGARGFSGAAASKEARAVFIKSAQEIVDKYGLDGIDVDWEYPVNGAWGQVDSQPADRDNFTLLLKALRQAMGPKNGSPSPSARMWKARKLAGCKSYHPVARRYQSDDLRHGLWHAVFQRQSV